MKTTRRGLFGILAGAIAAPAVAKIAPQLDFSAKSFGTVPFSFPTGYEDAVTYGFAAQYLRPAMVDIGNNMERIALSKPGVHFYRSPPVEECEVRILS